MLNKIFITIILLCGIASAEFLDNTNRNLCEVRNNETIVAIYCDITENTEKVKHVIFIMKHNVSECEECVFYKDGTWKHKLWYIYNNKGIVGSVLRDEYSVEIAKDANKTAVGNIKKLCMERYTQYKEAKNR